MATTDPQSAPSRPALLTAAMAAVLLAAIGIAYLLEAVAAGRVRAGGKILRQIHSQGLDHYWNEKGRIDWFLLRAGSSVVGWRASLRERIDDGGYAGAALNERIKPGQRPVQQVLTKWILDADASGGRYEGHVRLDRNLLLLTRIVLKDGTVGVIQEGHTGARVEASSPAPANYIPEGTLGLILRQVARRRADAQFAMVFDERQNTRGIVEFGTVRIRHAGPGRTDDGKPTERLRLSYRGWGKQDDLYELDEDGQILSIRFKDGTQCVPATQEEVTREFPRAVTTLRQRVARPTAGRPQDIFRRLFPGFF